MKIALISCSSKKLPGTMRAIDKYKASDLYCKSLEHAKKVEKVDAVIILSAKYGALLADDMVDDYNQSLTDLSKRGRQEWAAKVVKQLQQVLEPKDHVIIYAGKVYYECILEDLYNMVNHVTIPMKSMQIGERLKWLKEQLAQLPT